MKKIASTGLIIGAFLFGMASCNQEQGAVEEAQTANEEKFEGTQMEDRKISQSDFMTQAASNGMLEVEAGRLAQQKGLMQEVKSYGQTMVNDHTKANDQLKTLASQLNITLPDSMSQEHMDQLKNLQGLHGAEFDREYMGLMVSSHENAVSMFEDASNNMENAEVKRFATTTLPVLRQHLDRASQLNEAMQTDDMNVATPTEQ